MTINITDALRARGVGVGKKLVGDAQPADVRAGKTFSNATGNDKVGTVPVQTGGTVVPTTSDIVKPAGIYDVAITVQGDADLVSPNVKAGANIFGVAGATNVVDTTDVSTPASAAQIRSGRKAFVNGAPVTGTLSVQATGAQTVTPGTADVVKGAGIYDGAITIAGDIDLIAANILSGKDIFGVVGTLVPGKAWAKGTTTIPSATQILTISGLSFVPSLVMVYQSSTASHLAFVLVAVKGAATVRVSGSLYNGVEGSKDSSSANSIVGRNPTWNSDGLTLVTGGADVPVTYYVFE